MKKFIAVLFIATFAGNAVAASSADETFENLAEQFITDLPKFSPVSATLLGDHSADDMLDHVDAGARAAARKAYTDYLDAIDRDDLSRANQVDAELLRAEVESQLWSLDTLQEWAWTRSSINPERVPKIHAETAMAQNLGVVSIIEYMIIPEIDTLTAATRERLEAAIETAKNSLADHQTWLEEELLPRAAGDFRIGAELFDAKLAFTLNSPMSRKEIKAHAETEYESLRNQMYEIARDVYAGTHPHTAFPDNPDEAYKQVIIRAALEEAYQVLPPRDGIVDVAKAALQQATDFTIENNIVTVPDDPVEIIVMPEFQRGVSVAYLDAPGALDRGQKTFYAVAPLPEDWTEEQIRSFLREYNMLSIQVLSVHEGVPGHFLQLALSNRYPSTIRGVLGSGPMIEGWAEYSERVMIDAGYLDNDPLAKLIFMKWYLRAVTNAIIDSAIHVDGMTKDEAMKLMIEGGFQEEREAAGKWIRAQLSSTQLSTYFVGYQEHVEMRNAVEAEWGDEFTLRRYHDQALSYGSPPVKFIRALMLGEDIPQGGE